MARNAETIDVNKFHGPDVRPTIQVTGGCVMQSARERLAHGLRVFVVSLIFSMLSLASAQAQIYDAAADFSGTENPNGVWSYGYLAPDIVPDPTTFTSYLESFKPDDTNPPDTLDVWRIPSQIDPNVIHNGTATPVTISLVTWAPGQLSFHPGPNGEYSVVRWTAPIAGTYIIAATFTGIDALPTSTDVHILHNSGVLFEGIVNDYQIPHAFSTMQAVATGDTIDFIVGRGPNGDYTFDSTALDVTITRQETGVQIDIKPGSSPNSINPKSNGVIPVAILTTDIFDATTVDPLSVRFGPEGAKEAHNKGHIEDVNHDGEPDLVLHFRTRDTGIKCGDTSASLTGETFDGNPIQGSDTLKTVGCKK
jgi:hypothetical protein